MVEQQSVIAEIERVVEHPNADSLDLVTVLGYQCVTKRGSWRPGDLALYIIEKSVLSDDFIETHKCRDYLTGSEKNRVKDIKLRGELSQGMLLPLDEKYASLPVGSCLDLELGITKYAQQVPKHLAGRVKPRGDIAWPDFNMTNLRKLRGSERESMRDVTFSVTEKLHGTFCVIQINRVQDSPDSPPQWSLKAVSSKGIMERGLTLDLTDESNLYVSVAKKLFGDGKVFEAIEREFIGSLWKQPCDIYLYGEIFGPSVQDLGYGLKNKDVDFRLFDLYFDGSFDTCWVAGLDLDWFEEATKIKQVPSIGLISGSLSEDGDILTLAESLVKKRSILDSGTIMEGIVLRERNPRNPSKLVRYKVISPDYLTRKNATEYN